MMLTQRDKFIERLLQDVAFGKRITKEEIDNYLTRIGAPDDLIYIDQVAREMNDVIEILFEVSDELGEGVLHEWYEINSWIIANTEQLNEVGVQTYTAAITCPTIYGKSKSHPLYCMLWSGCDCIEYEKNYKVLKSIMFLLWPKLEAKTNRAGTINKNYLYKCSLLIRILGERKHRDILKKLPCFALKTREYLKAMHNKPNDVV